MTAISRYDYFKSRLIHKRIPLTDYELSDNLVLHTAASTLSGTVATSMIQSQSC